MPCSNTNTCRNASTFISRCTPRPCVVKFPLPARDCEVYLPSPPSDYSLQELCNCSNNFCDDNTCGSTENNYMQDQEACEMFDTNDCICKRKQKSCVEECGWLAQEKTPKSQKMSQFTECPRYLKPTDQETCINIIPPNGQNLTTDKASYCRYSCSKSPSIEKIKPTSDTSSQKPCLILPSNISCAIETCGIAKISQGIPKCHKPPNKTTCKMFDRATNVAAGEEQTTPIKCDTNTDNAICTICPMKDQISEKKAVDFRLQDCKQTSENCAIENASPTQQINIARETSQIKDALLLKNVEKGNKKMKKDKKRKAKDSKTSIKSNETGKSKNNHKNKTVPDAVVSPEPESNAPCTCQYPPAFSHYFHCTGDITGGCYCKNGT